MDLDMRLSLGTGSGMAIAPMVNHAV